MTSSELDRMTATMADHVALVEVLLQDRRDLFKALCKVTMALLVAERHLARNGDYIADLIGSKVPPDAAIVAKAELERVAFRV